MAKKAKKKNNRKKPTRPPAAFLRVAAWLLLAGLLCAAGWVGAVTAWQAVARSPQFRLDLQASALGETPAWVKAGAMSRELQQHLAELPAGISIFHPDVAAAVHRRLSACPWLLEVRGVERRLPNTLLIKGAFRKPAGIAVWGGSRYLIDGEGYALPDRLFNPPAEWLGKPMPVIEDRLLNQPPPVGRPWDWPRMAAGAQLCEYLRRAGLFDRLQITTIDVTGVGRGTADPDIVLTTASGAQIKWGASSLYADIGLEEPAFLIPDAEKLQMLLAKLGDYPGLRGIAYLDLRFHGKVYFREQE